MSSFIRNRSIWILSLVSMLLISLALPWSYLFNFKSSPDLIFYSWNANTDFYLSYGWSYEIFMWLLTLGWIAEVPGSNYVQVHSLLFVGITIASLSLLIVRIKKLQYFPLLLAIITIFYCGYILWQILGVAQGHASIGLGLILFAVSNILITISSVLSIFRRI
jgi:hypothetical protein